MDNKEELIKEAAISVFGQKGYSETKISDIAEKSGISIGTIYKYFKGKKELFESIEKPELKEIHPAFDGTRRKILFKASKYFANHGYRDTTMDKLAEQCNFSKATLYRFFSNKEDLFLSIIMETSTVIDYKSSLDTEIDMKEVMTKLATYYLKMLNEPIRINLIKMRLNEARRIPQAYLNIENEHLNYANNTLTDYLDVMKNKGIIQCENTQFAAQIFLNYLFNYTIQERLMYNRKLSDPNNYIKGIVNMFLHGVNYQES